MGIHDRDYYRTRPKGGFGHFSFGSVTAWLIALNISVFVLDGILRLVPRPIPDDIASLLAPHLGVDYILQFWFGPLTRWGYFSTDAAIVHGQAWRFITFQFLHSSPMHLLANMLALFFFGPIVEAHFFARRYIGFYLLCGLAGAASYLLLGAMHVLPHGPQTPLVGASAGTFGLLVAAAMIAPDVQVWAYYGFPITVRTLAVISMALAAYAVFAAGPYAHNAGGEAAHLGGGVLGFLLMKNQHWLNVFASRRRMAIVTSTPSRAQRRRRTMQKDWSKDFNR